MKGRDALLPYQPLLLNNLKLSFFGKASHPAKKAKG